MNYYVNRASLPNSFNDNQEARFHFHTIPSTTPKPQPQTEKHPSPTLSPKSQLEKPFPDTSKHEFQDEIPLSDTMKAKFQVEISFLYKKKVISQKKYRLFAQAESLNEN